MGSTGRLCKEDCLETALKGISGGGEPCIKCRQLGLFSLACWLDLFNWTLSTSVTYICVLLWNIEKSSHLPSQSVFNSTQSHRRVLTVPQTGADSVTDGC